MEKFIERNQENLEKLDKFIDDNSGDIGQIVMSPELLEGIKMLPDYDEIFISISRYKKIKIKVDPYAPAQRLYFIRKSEAIDFNIPCICGLYSDEQHPHP